MYFENVNGILAQNLLFSQNDSLNIKYDVVFKSPVSVESELLSTSGKVNEIILNNEIVTTERHYNGSFFLLYIFTNL